MKKLSFDNTLSKMCQNMGYVFWLSSALGVLSTLVTSVVLYSLTRATLMSPGQSKTYVCGYI